LIDFTVIFLLFVPVQVIAWRTVSEMTCNVSSGTLNLTDSLTHTLELERLINKQNTVGSRRATDTWVQWSRQATSTSYRVCDCSILSGLCDKQTDRQIDTGGLVVVIGRTSTSLIHRRALSCWTARAQPRNRRVSGEWVGIDGWCVPAPGLYRNDLVHSETVTATLCASAIVIASTYE